MLYLLKLVKCFPSLLRSNVADTALLVFACLLHLFTGLQNVCAARGARRCSFLFWGVQQPLLDGRLLGDATADAAKYTPAQLNQRWGQTLLYSNYSLASLPLLLDGGLAVS